jgi:hypothetical protein
VPVPTMKPVVLLTVIPTGTLEPTPTEKVVGPVVDERLKVSVVLVTVRLTVAVCDVPPAPLGVAVTVMVGVTGVVMLAAVVMVKVTFWECMPSSVTLVGLKLQVTPAVRPAVHPLGGEVVALKLTVWVEPLTGAMVKVATADCPAAMDAGANAPATKVKSDVTLTTAAGRDEEALSLTFPP